MYDVAPSRLGSLQGLLLFKFPSGPAAALPRELDGHHEVKVALEAVAVALGLPSSAPG